MRSLLLCCLLLAACAGPPPPDRIRYETIESHALGKPMAYGVYTPPGWDGQTRLPLVVFLHGSGDDEATFSRHRVVTQNLDEWIDAGRLPPFLMVIPDGERGFWTNWDDGTHPYEDWVLEEVVPAMTARYPVEPGRDGLHLMGVSMGGAGALFISLDHRDRFASTTVLSAPIFDVDQVMKFLDRAKYRGAPLERIFGPADREKVEGHNPFAQLRSPEDLQGTRLFIGAGSWEIFGILPTTRRFHTHLEEHGVPHWMLVYRGRHRWKDWARVIPVALCLQLAPDTCERPDDGFYSLDEID